MAKASRALRGRMRSVQNTRKITRTMELVSTSKLKRAQDRVVAARPYAAALAEVIADLVTPELAERFPLLRQPAPPAKGGPRGQPAGGPLPTPSPGRVISGDEIGQLEKRVAALEADVAELRAMLAGRPGGPAA